MALTLPYTGPLDHFQDCKDVKIKGFINNPPPNQFAINLLCGRFPEDNIALQFKARFDQGKVVLNTRTNGTWGRDKIVDQLPFKKSHEFNVRIEATAFNYYQIYVNGTSFTTFQARLNMEDVKFLHITGEQMSLLSVEYR